MSKSIAQTVRSQAQSNRVASSNSARSRNGDNGSVIDLNSMRLIALNSARSAAMRSSVDYSASR